MTVIGWITEGTWPACVDAARAYAAPDADVVLLHVTGRDLPDAARGAYAGLLGRGHRERDPGARLQDLAAGAAERLLQAAADRLGRPCIRVERSGRTEREVIAAAQDADLLIAARDGDRTRLGPRSLSPVTRFVVDHAPCAVLLIWPEPPPDVATIPATPPRTALRRRGHPPR